MTRLRVAIAGLGIGRQHLAAYRKLPDRYDVVTLCEPDAERGARVAAEFAVSRIVRGFDEVLAQDDVDVVDICTPHSLHYRQVLDTLAAGKHVICEKPVVGSLAECDMLIEAERRSGKRAMPVFQYRFGAGLQKLLHLIGRGVAGRHYLSTAETSWRRGTEYYKIGWRGKLSAAMGGCLLTQAIHAHDALTLAAGEVRRVYAATATRVNPVETEDCAVAALTLADHSLASLSVTLGGFDEISRLHFCFEHMTVQSSLAPYTMTAEPWTFLPANNAAARRMAAALADFQAGPEGFVGQFLRFHEAIDGGAEIPVSLADARRSLELLTAMYHSAAHGAAIELPIPASHPAYAGWLATAHD